MGFVINMLERNNVEKEHLDSYPGVKAEQTDASGVDNMSDRVCAGTI